VLSNGARPIQQDSTCRIFEIIFERKHIISYTVLNESYERYPEPPENFTGKLFRIFSWSHLLEFTRRTTYANDQHPGVLKHFEIACLNHMFDTSGGNGFASFYKPGPLPWTLTWTGGTIPADDYFDLSFGSIQSQ
jgi:hypothetical protein